MLTYHVFRYRIEPKYIALYNRILHYLIWFYIVTLILHQTLTCSHYIILYTFCCIVLYCMKLQYIVWYYITYNIIYYIILYHTISYHIIYIYCIILYNLLNYIVSLIWNISYANIRMYQIISYIKSYCRMIP